MNSLSSHSFLRVCGSGTPSHQNAQTLSNWNLHKQKCRQNFHSFSRHFQIWDFVILELFKSLPNPEFIVTTPNSALCNT